ncbi:MAG: TolC family protein [Cyanobacteriota bacterium]
MQGADRRWADRRWAGRRRIDGKIQKVALALALTLGTGVCGRTAAAPTDARLPAPAASTVQPLSVRPLTVRQSSSQRAAARGTPDDIAGRPLSTPLRLSLPRALALGLDQSLSLRSSSLLVQEGQALVGLAHSRFLPRIDIVGLGTYGQVGTSIGFVSNLSSVGDLNIDLGGDGYAVVQNTFLNLGLALTLPVVDFNRGPLQQAARSELRAARAELSEQERRSRFEIISAYLFSQQADAQIPVWERSLEVSNTLLRDAGAIRRRGLAARIDTLQAEALVQTDRQGLAEAQAQQQVARSALARALNLPASQAVSTSDNLLPWPAWPLGLEATLQRSLAQRPALEGLEQQRQAQLARVQLARAARLPSVGLLVGGGVSGDWLNLPVLNGTPRVDINAKPVAVPGVNAPGSTSGGFYDWGLVLSLRQPLYDGGASRSSTELAQRRVERAEVALDQARQAIVQNVQTWYASHQAAGAQRTSAAAAASAGEESVRDALLRYRAGIAPITELLMAHRSLQLARTAEATATHRWNLSRAGLALESGLDDLPDGRSQGNVGAYSSSR